MEQKKHLYLPVTEEQIRELRVGEVVYLSGVIIQMRSAAHARAAELLNEGKSLPFELKNGAIYHAYSCNVQEGGIWHLCYIGPTLSYRMSKYAPVLIEKGGVRVFIGKAGDGMNEETLKAMREFGCVHLSQVGGVTAYNTSHVIKLVDVYWEDLGLDRVFTYEVKEMGPLIVTMDTLGQNLYFMQDKVQEKALK